MSDTQQVIAGNGPSEWQYEIPPRTDAKVQLLTIGFTAVHGEWYGKYGEFFIAWCQLPKRDKEREKQLGLIK